MESHGMRPVCIRVLESTAASISESTHPLASAASRGAAAQNPSLGGARAPSGPQFVIFTQFPRRLTAILPTILFFLTSQKCRVIVITEKTQTFIYPHAA